jgi:hypothetical protein
MPAAKIIHTRDYELFCQGQLADPYPVLRELRNTEPVHWCEPWECWIVTSYDDVQQGHLHSRLSSDKARITMNALSEELRTRVDGLGKHLALWVSHTDPPGHKRLRESVQQPFVARNVLAMRDRITAIANELVDTVAVSGRMDVISDFAYLMPVTVICERMGIPLEDITRFQAWVEDIVAFTDAPASGWAETAEVALSGLTCLSQYFKEIIQHKRDEPGEDMISQLVSPEPWSDALHAQKLLAMCVQLLVGAHDTTSALIGNSLLLLLQNPEVAEQLGARPERIESAIEEFLRYESPAPRNSRIAMADLELGGQQIREGQTVALMLSAANRDPQQFSDPDRLDISRSPNRHLAFGSGAHFCLGAPLARLEGQIAITTILQRLPGLRPVEQSALERPLWHASTGLRMLKTLPVMFDV